MPNQSQLSRSTAPVARPRTGAILTVLAAASFMASLDLFIVNVAFADIGRDFHGTPIADLSWILNGYAILYAALLVPLGRLADRYGRKAGFMLGLGVFTAASAACAASPGLWWLVSFRALQAIGAAALTPTSLGLLLAATPAPLRGRAVRIWAMTGALAAAFGPAVGGVLVNASWRWVFIVNVPVGIAALVATISLIPDSRDQHVSRLPDLVGASLLAGAIGALALGLVKGSEWGWTSAATLAAFALAVGGIAVFWWRSERHHSPVVEPALLKVRTFAWSNLTVLVFMVGFAANLLATILWMQDEWHYSPIRTGLAVAPGPLLVPVMSIAAQRYASHISAGTRTAIGCFLFGAGAVFMLARVGADPSYATEILPGWLLAGVGVGLALPTIMSSATLGLPLDRAATGSAVVNMSRQIGAVLGVSVLVAVLGSTGSDGAYAAAHAHFQDGWWFVAGASWLAAASAFGMNPARTRAVVAKPQLVASSTHTGI